jgi:vanillate O-demethylase ferredoxin subunit
MPVTQLVRVKSLSWEGETIRAYDLRPLPGEELSAFTAGAHIDLHLPAGMVRSYSLANAPAERHRYRIAVGLAEAGRGGSRHLHDAVKAGDVLRIGRPRNLFPLIESASHSLFLAGGIGITPILSMIQRLDALGRGWTLHYRARRPEGMAFLDELAALDHQAPGRVLLSFSDGTGAARPNLPDLLGALAPGGHAYCCGPQPMLEAFLAAGSAAGVEPDRLHVEHFAAAEAPARAGGITLVLARSGRELQVEPGHSILDAVTKAGIRVNYSCREGACGACETRVLEGQPDHRDRVLSEAERASGTTMMICCSGCKGDRLMLDL